MSSTLCGSSMRGSLRVDANPVVANVGLQPTVVGIAHEHVRGMHRHVAIDAVGSDLLSHFSIHAALVDAVTAKASRGVLGGRALGRMNIVASGARHFRRVL